MFIFSHFWLFSPNFWAEIVVVKWERYIWYQNTKICFEYSLAISLFYGENVGNIPFITCINVARLIMQSTGALYATRTFNVSSSFFLLLCTNVTLSHKLAWLMITMTIKNFNRCNSHVTMAQSAFTSTQLQPCCAKRQVSTFRIWNQIFILKVSEGRWANQSTQRKPPIVCPLISIT